MKNNFYSFICYNIVNVLKKIKLKHTENVKKIKQPNLKENNNYFKVNRFLYDE